MKSKNIFKNYEIQQVKNLEKGKSIQPQKCWLEITHVVVSQHNVILFFSQTYLSMSYIVCYQG